MAQLIQLKAPVITSGSRLRQFVMFRTHCSLLPMMTCRNCVFVLVLSSFQIQERCLMMMTSVCFCLLLFGLSSMMQGHSTVNHCGGGGCSRQLKVHGQLLVKYTLYSVILSYANGRSLFGPCQKSLSLLLLGGRRTEYRYPDDIENHSQHP